MAFIIKWIDLLLMSLLVGTMFGIWLGFNPAALSAQAYVEQQQQMIRAFNDALPGMGFTCIALTIVLAIMTKGDWRSRSSFAVAVVCLIASGLITRFQNQPINAVVITWSADAPPANWMQLRDEWWRWHVLRTGASIAALSLSLFASIGRPMLANAPTRHEAA